MNKTSFTKTLLFFLLVGIEHTNASSNNLGKRKATVTITQLIDTISSIFMKEDWSCCDGTNEPTPVPTVTVNVPTSSSTSPSLSVTITPITTTPLPTPTPTNLKPTFIPTTYVPSLIPSSSTSPTYMEKKFTPPGLIDFDMFGYSCSITNELIVIGGIWLFLSDGAAYLYHLNGNQIKKLTPSDDRKNDELFGYSVSMDEKVVVAGFSLDYVDIFSLEGEYERSITCNDCSYFGRYVATYGERVVISGEQNSFLHYLYIYTTEGELLKTIDNGDEEINDVDISDEVIVFTTELNTVVYSNTAPDFEEMAEIPQGGRFVATSGDRVVIGDYRTNGNVGTVWLYETGGTFRKNLEHDSEKFGRSVDITDDKILVGATFDDEGGDNAGAVFIYSADGDFQEKVLAPDGEVNDYFGGCVSATDSYLVVGAVGVDDRSGEAYLFPLSD